jgi:hypothetical protein
VLRKLQLKTAALPSVNAIPEYGLVYATCNNDCVSISCMEYIDVSYNVSGCVLVVLSDSSYLSYAAVMSVYGVRSSLYSFSILKYKCVHKNGLGNAHPSLCSTILYTSYSISGSPATFEYVP